MSLILSGDLGATYGATKWFALGKDGVTDGVSFYVQASVSVSIVSTSFLLSLGNPQLTFTYQDADGDHTRLVDALPDDTGMLDGVGPLTISLFGTWAFTPSGDNALFHADWEVAVGDSLGWGGAGADSWEAVVTFTPEAVEIDAPVVVT